MSLALFIKKIHNNQAVSFDETIAVINENYEYCPAEFINGGLVNTAGANEGSCKIFAFAQMNNLDQQQTLQLFGEYYRHDVLNAPDGMGHQNIRNFMRFGWDGIQYNGSPLTLKQSS